ncbi:hypothetical protein [Micromonospora sp. HUAS LYJ1]|uniref:hypothetical protein n=1 Tax=Micromonospora sp. HUAS LYJ1 TaxID=3061626 RepID=UPI0026728CC3|nr:hypothetical protein [Micromonospora sp. HUAS LYJ1]WKU03858.1 hypothetical protein Q2K16_23910 [Micromonospora sp. HUAS LYJ1]
MTEQEAAEWQERLQAATAAAVRRREDRRKLRAQLDAARAIGLQRRHHQKLHRKV